MITITKIFNYEMAHALHRYDGACANIHGHSYRLEVTITGEPITDKMSPKCGMIIDFGDLKRIVEDAVLKRIDHALVLNSASDEELKNMLKKHYDNIVFVDYQPTSENLLEDFAKRIQDDLPVNVQLIRMRMYETSSSYAEWLLN